MVLSKNTDDALHSDDLTKKVALRWHNACPTLDCVSFPTSTWVHNKRYGWVTLGALERILAEREKVLHDKQRDLREQQQALDASHRRLDGIEQRLETLSVIYSPSTAL